jgi:hypothetical protein
VQEAGWKLREQMERMAKAGAQQKEEERKVRGRALAVMPW